jgi:ABC-2 type transport system ATP-binding protein
MPVIELNNVSKTYFRAADPAVDQFNLKVYAGERIGLIGANGSGKTTIMRLLLNFVLPEKGSISIMGESNLEKARKHIGFVPERQEGMENFTPRELLQISARMYGMDSTRSKEKIQSLLEFAELSEVSGNLLSDFSKGMSQRVHICIALIHDPKILLLDEPMSGLDPGGQKDVRDILLKLKDITMIYASHNLDEIETFCTKVVIIHHGKLIRELSLEEIRQEVFTLELESRFYPLLEKFPDLKPEILSQQEDTIQVQFIAWPDVIRKIMAVFNEHQIEIRRLRSRSVLEHLYHRYVADSEN